MCTAHNQFEEGNDKCVLSDLLLYCYIAVWPKRGPETLMFIPVSLGGFKLKPHLDAIFMTGFPSERGRNNCFAEQNPCGSDHRE